MPIAVQLKTGKTIYIDAAKYVTMSDEEFENLTADDIGSFVDNPFRDEEYIPEVDLLDDDNLED